MINTLLPTAVAIVTDTSSTSVSADSLPVEEAEAVARAVEARRVEFARGRICARAALARLGSPVRAVVVGADRGPVWPPGVVGSITHCRGYVAAAVAWRRDFLGVGIDAEPSNGLTDDIIDAICTAAERTDLARRAADIPWAMITFSAKETIYKCVPPCARIGLRFQNVRLIVQDDGTFTAESSKVDLRGVCGRWCATNVLVLTAATLSGK